MRNSELSIYRIFKVLVKPFIGSGIGRFKPLNALYQSIAKSLLKPEQFLVNVNDYKMFLHASDVDGIDGISQHILFKGTYEPLTTELFNRLVKPGMTVIDIGANIGYFTLLAAKLVGKEGKVYAFEPESKNYELLIKNININKFDNVVPIQKAITAKSGKTELFINRMEPGAHSIFKENGRCLPSIIVETVSLDEFCENKHILPDLIKIDVEGAEIGVLRGANKVITKQENVKIIIEFSPDNIKKAGFSNESFWSQLIQGRLEYIYLISDQTNKLKIVNLQSIMKMFGRTPSRRTNYVNLLCSKSPITIS